MGSPSDNHADAHEIAPGIFLGNYRFAYDRYLLSAMGITHILNAAKELATPFRDIVYKHFTMDDSVVEPIDKNFKESHQFIDEALGKGGKVLVHCYAGISRSSTLLGSYLMKKYGLTPEGAILHMKKIRPIVDPNPGFRDRLRHFHQNGYPQDKLLFDPVDFSDDDDMPFLMDDFKPSAPPLVTSPNRMWLSG